jgi:hypothetical protein
MSDYRPKHAKGHRRLDNYHRPARVSAWDLIRTELGFGDAFTAVGRNPWTDTAVPRHAAPESPVDPTDPPGVAAFLALDA